MKTCGCVSLYLSLSQTIKADQIKAHVFILDLSFSRFTPRPFGSLTPLGSGKADFHNGELILEQSCSNHSGLGE